MNASAQRLKSAMRWGVAWSLFGIFSSAIYGLVSLRLCLQYIPLEGWGMWLAVSNVVAWVGAIDPGTSTIVQQRVAHWDGQGREEEVKGVCFHGIRWSFLIYVIILLIGLLLYIATHYTLAVSVDSKMPHDWEMATLISVVSVASSIFGYTLSAICVGLLRQKFAGVWNQASMWISLICLWFLLGCGWGVLAPAFAAGIRALGFVIGHWIIMRDRIAIRMPRSCGDEDIIAAEIRNGIKITFVPRLIGVIAYNMDAIIIAKVLGPIEAAVFGSVKKLPEFLRQVTEKPLATVAIGVTHLQARGNKSNLRNSVNLCLRWTYVSTAAAFIVVVCTIYPFAIYWLKIDGSMVTSDIVLSAALVGAASTCAHSSSILVFALGKIRLSSVVGMAQAIAATAIVPIGAYHSGILGVGIGVFLCLGSAVIVFIWTIALSVGPLGASHTRSLALCLMVVGFVALIVSENNQNGLSVMSNIGVCASALILVYLITDISVAGLKLWNKSGNL